MRHVLILIAVLLGIAPGAGLASHHPFDVAFDRFEVDGQPYGPKDGTPDLVDDFDDGMLAPMTIFFGTASESGGLLHLTNPGFDASPLDESCVYRPGGDAVDGGGDVCITALWPPVSLAVDRSVGTGFANGSTGESTTVAIANFDSATGAFYGASAGLFVTVHREAPPATPVTISTPIAEADITGVVHFRVCLDDWTNTATPSISLDGGTTFQTLSQTATFELGSQNAIIIAGAVELTTTTTTSSTTSSSTSTTLPVACGAVPTGGCKLGLPLKSSLRLLDKAGTVADQLKWKWNKGAATSGGDFKNPLNGVSMHVCLYDASANSQPLMDAVIATGPNCGPDFLCWKAIDPGHPKGYKLASGAGLPDGIVGAKLLAGVQDKAKLQVKGKGPNLSLPGLPLSLPVTVQLQITDGAGTTCWESTFSTTSLNDAQQFKAKGP